MNFIQDESHDGMVKLCDAAHKQNKDRLLSI